MMDEHYFYSIEHQQTTTIKIKRSVFICTLEYVDSIEKAKNFISRISKENKMATHNCWAYILGEKGDIFHCSDAGELKNLLKLFACLFLNFPHFFWLF